jgi:hypothetical protein
MRIFCNSCKGQECQTQPVALKKFSNWWEKCSSIPDRAADPVVLLKEDCASFVSSEEVDRSVMPNSDIISCGRAGEECVLASVPGAVLWALALGPGHLRQPVLNNRH